MSRLSLKAIQAAAGNAGEAVDDDFANVVLLLDGDGTSGDENSTFTCENGTSGASVSTFTEVGNVIQGSFSPYGNNWSVYFDGQSSLDVGSNVYITNLGSGDLTVEFFINTTDTSCNLLNPNTNSGSGYWGLMIQNGDLRWNNAYNSTNLWVVDGAPILDGEWHHVAIVRNSGTFAVYYDGVAQSLQSGSFSDTTNYSGANKLRIGNGNLNHFTGYLSNVKLITANAIYTSDFTPPTSPLENTPSGGYVKCLVCRDNRFIDSGNYDHDVTLSQNNPKVTPFGPFKYDDARDITVDGGSAYFDGSSYLHAPTNHGIRPENGGYTIEGWFYATKNTTQILFDARKNSNTNATPVLWITNGDDLNFWHGYGTSTASNCFNLNEWVHVVANRDGSTTELFCNGVRVKDFNNTGTIYSFEQHFGARWDNGALLDEGYLADWRIEEKVKLYTGSTITVPTAPVGVRTTTDSYMSFQEAGIYDRTGLNNVDTFGTAQIDTSVVKYGTGSIEFDGNSDYLLGSENPADVLAVKDAFTAECWFYQTATAGTGSGIHALISHWNNNTGNKAFVMGMSGTSMVLYVSNDGSTNNISGATGGTVSNNTWNHAALTWDGTNYRVFLNGTAVITQANSSAPYASNEVIQIGASKSGGSGSISMYYQGYMDDIRITNGIARYTSSFTPPTAALPKF